jgi:L-fuconolactonase
VIIDAHLHLWERGRSPYLWNTAEVPSLHRDYRFDDALPHLERHGVTGAVLVQADDHPGDTDLMLEVAAAHPQVVAVVAHVPLDAPDEAAARLAELRRDPCVVGVRAMIHDLDDPDFLLRPDVDEGLGVLEEADVTFDLVTRLPRHLEHAVTLSERHPGLRIVVDHLGRPPLGGRSWEPWASLLAEAAAVPTVHAKVSGLYPESDPLSWRAAEVQEVVERALELFGPRRLMYGGDWPISVLAGGYDAVLAGVRDALAHLGPEDAAQVWGETALRFYRVDPGRVVAAGLRSAGS